MIPLSRDNNRMVKNFPLLYRGINRNVLTDDSDWHDTNNIDTTNIPTISPRDPMKEIGGYDDVLGYFCYENVEFVIEQKPSTVRLYINVYNENGELASTTYKLLANKNIKEYQIFLFRRYLVIFPSCESFEIVFEDDNVHLFKELKNYRLFSLSDGNEKGMDNLMKAIEYNDRIFGFDNSETIHASMQETYDNFRTTATGIINESWWATVASEGRFIGINKYRDHVIIMKQNLTYELYGTDARNFSLRELFKLGTINNKAICEANGRLFFVDSSGVFMYTGGNPRRISYKLCEKYEDAVCHSDNRRLYMSLDNGETKRTYVYDTELDTWTGYTDKYFDFYTNISYGGRTYIRGVCNNRIYQFETGDEAIEWEAETKRFDDNTFQKKTVKKLKFRCLLEKDSEIKFFLSVNDRPYKLHAMVKHPDTYDNMNDINVYIPLIRAKNFKIRLEGKGSASVRGEREMIYRSER